MGFFDSISKVVKNAKKFEDVFDNVKDAVNKNADKKEGEKKEVEKKVVDEKKQAEAVAELKLANTKHWATCDDYPDDDEYELKYLIDDSFKEADSHVGEVMMLNTYSPDNEYGEEGEKPYVAIQMDNFVYNAVEEFKASKTVKGAIELTPLEGKFYFKAKKAYCDDMMYFYGLDRCNGYWENQGLCLVYPKSYVGTAAEEQLIKMFDELAESYTEIKK